MKIRSQNLGTKRPLSPLFKQILFLNDEPKPTTKERLSLQRCCDDSSRRSLYSTTSSSASSSTSFPTPLTTVAAAVSQPQRRTRRRRHSSTKQHPQKKSVSFATEDLTSVQIIGPVPTKYRPDVYWSNTELQQISQHADSCVQQAQVHFPKYIQELSSQQLTVSNKSRMQWSKSDYRGLEKYYLQHNTTTTPAEHQQEPKMIRQTLVTYSKCLTTLQAENKEELLRIRSENLTHPHRFMAQQKGQCDAIVVTTYTQRWWRKRW